MKEITILIAVRNEENNIIECLTHIQNLSYPYFEVLIGNDNSSDNSKTIIEKFIANKPNFHLFDIFPSENPNLKGKTNVLAQLIKKTKNEIIFVTDADTCVSKEWIQNFMLYFNQKNAIITGVTIPKSTSFFGKMQALEWAEIFGIIDLFAKKNIALTSIGNNMAFEKKEYEKIGGYENLPFSLTEDFLLFQKIVKNGGKFKQLYDEKSMSFTQSTEKLTDWISQRKRWLYGAMQVNLFFSFLLLCKAFSGIFLLILSFFSVYFLFIFLAIEFTRLFFLYFNLKKIKKINLIIYFPFLSIFHCFISPIVFFEYFFNKKVVWKGREFISKK
ncbi:MAG: glycosyltransferase [Bacteroidetes bacterium]|nr:MAG: glycosyltransferase [Bacteroidota bacterium]